MLINLLLGGDIKNALITFLLLLPAVCIALSVHEFSHGLAAYALGDMTAKNSGRLTLDPIAHLDKIGFLFMLLVGFGWASPVPVNMSNFKIKNKKVGMAIVAFAGPLSNMVLAFLFIAIGIAISNVQGVLGQVLYLFCYYISRLSVSLGVFNLIPIHPLDGSRILDAILPLKYSMKLQGSQGILIFVTIAIIWFGFLTPVINTVYSGIQLAAYAIFA